MNIILLRLKNMRLTKSHVNVWYELLHDRVIGTFFFNETSINTYVCGYARELCHAADVGHTAPCYFSTRRGTSPLDNDCGGSSERHIFQAMDRYSVSNL